MALGGQRHAARLCRHGGRSDPRGVPPLLRGAGAQARPVLVADPPARVRPAADERRHEPVHPVLPRARAGAVPACRDRPEGLPRGRHRPRRTHRAPLVHVRDARELLVRRLLQGRVLPLGLRARHRGLWDRARPAVGHRVPDRRRGDRDLAGHRDPRRADRSPWRAGQLLVDARGRPRRTLFGDLRGPRTQVRGRRWTRGRRGAPHRDLEPRVHAGRGRRPHADRARAPQQEHRHGGQRGAPGRRPAGRGPRVRDRPAAAARRGRRVALGTAIGEGRARRRLAQGDRRARPSDHVPDSRRRAALERGARLPRAPDAPSRRLARAAARDRTGGHAGAGRTDG